VAFSVGGDGGRKLPEHSRATLTRRCGSQRLPKQSHTPLERPRARFAGRTLGLPMTGAVHGKAPAMARKLRLKVVAICQDDGGKRGGVAACYNFAGPGGHVLINAQIAFSCAANF